MYDTRCNPPYKIVYHEYSYRFVLPLANGLFIESFGVEITICSNDVSSNLKRVYQSIKDITNEKSAINQTNVSSMT